MPTTEFNLTTTFPATVDYQTRYGLGRVLVEDDNGASDGTVSVQGKLTASMPWQDLVTPTVGELTNVKLLPVYRFTSTGLTFGVWQCHSFATADHASRVSYSISLTSGSPTSSDYPAGSDRPPPPAGQSVLVWLEQKSSADGIVKFQGKINADQNNYVDLDTLSAGVLTQTDLLPIYRATATGMTTGEWVVHLTYLP